MITMDYKNRRMGLGRTPIFSSVSKKNCPPYVSKEVHCKHITDLSV